MIIHNHHLKSCTSLSHFSLLRIFATCLSIIHFNIDLFMSSFAMWPLPMRHSNQNFVRMLFPQCLLHDLPTSSFLLQSPYNTGSAKHKFHIPVSPVLQRFISTSLLFRVLGVKQRVKLPNVSIDWLPFLIRIRSFWFKSRPWDQLSWSFRCFPLSLQAGSRTVT
jgi:hypothetical protein